MEDMILEPLVEKNFSLVLMRKPDAHEEDKKLNDVAEFFENIDLKFATVDLGYMETRDFNNTSLADVLKELNIPFFTQELPHYVKGHFAKEIADIKNKLDELKGTYKGLVNKNTASAQELKLLIDRYTQDLEAIDKYINLQIRPEAIMKKILSVLKDREEEDLTFIHFGEEQSFIEVKRQLKERKVKSSVVFIQLSRFL